MCAVEGGGNHYPPREVNEPDPSRDPNGEQTVCRTHARRSLFLSTYGRRETCDRPQSEAEGDSSHKHVLVLRACNKTAERDPRRRSSVDGYGCGAASRSVVGSCRTVLANSTTSAERRTAARLRSRVSHRHTVRPPQRHPLADAPAGTRVRVGDDVLAPPARLATSGRVGSHSLRAAGLARSKRSD